MFTEQDLQSFARMGHLDVVQGLLGWSGTGGEWVDPRAKKNKAVRLASWHGHLEVVSALLEWSGPGGEWVDPRVKKNKAVRLASLHGHVEVVQALLGWSGPGGEWVDPTVNNANITAVTAASLHGHVAVVKALLVWRGPEGQWVDPRVWDNQAVRCASKKGNLELLVELLDWRGPGGEWVNIGAARVVTRRQDILLLCDEAEGVRARWTSVRQAWVGAVVRSVFRRDGVGCRKKNRLVGLGPPLKMVKYCE